MSCCYLSTTQSTSHLSYLHFHGFHEILCTQLIIFATNSFVFQIHLQSCNLVHSILSPAHIEHISPLSVWVRICKRFALLWSPLFTSSTIYFGTIILVLFIHFDSHRLLWLALSSSILIHIACSAFKQPPAFTFHNLLALVVIDLIRFCAEDRVKNPPYAAPNLPSSPTWATQVLSEMYEIVAHHTVL